MHSFIARVLIKSYVCLPFSIIILCLFDTFWFCYHSIQQEPRKKEHFTIHKFMLLCTCFDLLWFEHSPSRKSGPLRACSVFIRSLMFLSMILCTTRAEIRILMSLFSFHPLTITCQKVLTKNLPVVFHKTLLLLQKGTCYTCTHLHILQQCMPFNGFPSVAIMYQVTKRAVG